MQTMGLITGLACFEMYEAFNVKRVKITNIRAFESSKETRQLKKKTFYRETTKMAADAEGLLYDSGIAD